MSQDLQLPFPPHPSIDHASSDPEGRTRAVAAPEPTTAPDSIDAPGFRVEVTRSEKRRRTVGARLVGDVLEIAIPARMTRADEQRWTLEMTRRFQRMRSTERFDLVARAGSLAHRFGLATPRVIKWSDDMTTRWGSCTPADGTIRISTRVAAFPDWVVDYVIVHELAHLRAPGHGNDFWELVRRYPKCERAIGFLIAKSGEAADDID